MTDLITICGCSGGTEGPQSIYKYFLKESQETGFNALSYTTLADDVPENAKRVTALVKKNFEKANHSVILIGHSMGAAAAALAAKNLQTVNPLLLKGVVLINPQSEGLYHLESVTAPLLFIYGEEDDYFPLWQLKSSFGRHAGPKQMILLPKLGHSLQHPNGKKSREHTSAIGDLVLTEMQRAFFTTPLTKEHTPKTVDLLAKSQRSSCNIL